MGNFFSNIHIKKEKNIDIANVIESFSNLMTSNGYNLETNKEKSDGKLTIVSSTNSQWITVFSDLLELNTEEDYKKIFNFLNLKTDFLGIYCYDSDYLFLNLLNSKTDAWINVRNILRN